MVDPFAKTMGVACYVRCDRAGGPAAISLFWFVYFTEYIELGEWARAVLSQMMVNIGNIHWVEDIFKVYGPGFESRCSSICKQMGFRFRGGELLVDRWVSKVAKGVRNILVVSDSTWSKSFVSVKEEKSNAF